MASNRAFIAGILVVLGLGAFASIAAANNFGKGAPSLDPEAGLSNSQREDNHRSLESAFQQKYGDWLNSSVAKQQDLRRLEHHELNAAYLAAQPTLIDAASHADSIIAGTVTKIAFEPSRRCRNTERKQDAKGTARKRSASDPGRGAVSGS